MFLWARLWISGLAGEVTLGKAEGVKRLRHSSSFLCVGSLCLGFVESLKVTQLFLIKVTQKCSNKQGVIAKTAPGSQASSSCCPGPEAGKGIIKIMHYSVHKVSCSI